MQFSKRYRDNVEKWSLLCPKEAENLLHPNMQVKLNTTGPNELNLLVHEGNKTYYCHSTDNAAEEANLWFAVLDLYNITTLIVYGVGLGYYYTAAKEWLKEDSSRRLIFFEHNLEVIAGLFETETGTELLHDNQVLLLALQFAENEDPQNLEQRYSSILYRLFIKNIRVSALGKYEENYPKRVFSLNIHLQFIKNVKIYHVMEYMTYGEFFFHNYYRNLLKIPDALLGDCLFEKFKGMPAIICGAGPSLDKQIPLLNELRDKALIFAGGSAMNAISSQDVLPHFGVSIDPNIGQYVRLTMNHAFEVPYFYRNRMYPEALDAVHGPHLFLTGSGGYTISKWMENELGILQIMDVQEGNNVTNFNLSIAIALGCNPIILVGVDLAFTDMNSYASGVQPHPIFDKNRHLESKGTEDEVVYRYDVYGQPVPTLWKWISESTYYTQVLERNPHLTFINATEGGLGFDKIINLPLKQTAEIYLRHPQDFNALVHGELCNSPMPEDVTQKKIALAMETLKSSLQKCDAFYKELGEIAKQRTEEIIKNHILPVEQKSEQTINEKITQETAYKYVIKQFEGAFNEYYGSVDLLLLQPESANSHKIARAINESQTTQLKYAFLKRLCEINIRLLNQTIEEQKLKNAVDKAFLEKPELLPKEPTNIQPPVYEHYPIESGRMHIDDSELGIHINEPYNTEINVHDFQMDGKNITKYSDGNPKFVQHYRQGALHGPSIYYGNDGKILAFSCFINGMRQGKSWKYYPSGEIYSLQRYQDGKLYGKQEYFYKNGSHKSIITYLDGKLNGTTTLYHSNGVKKRELSFKKGKKTGLERAWNYGGVIELEFEWKNDLPIGSAKMWYGNKQLAREVIYDDNSKAISSNSWTLEGHQLPSENLEKNDYFEKVTKQTLTLTENLQTMFNQINTLPAQLENVMHESNIEHPAIDISKDLQALQAEMEHLKQLSEQMKKQSELVDSDVRETLWKTPETRRQLGKHIQEVTKGMHKDITEASKIIHKSEEKLKKLDNNQTGTPESHE